MGAHRPSKGAVGGPRGARLWQAPSKNHTSRDFRELRHTTTHVVPASTTQSAQTHRVREKSRKHCSKQKSPRVLLEPGAFLTMGMFPYVMSRQLVSFVVAQRASPNAIFPVISTLWVVTLCLPVDKPTGRQGRLDLVGSK